MKKKRTARLLSTLLMAVMMLIAGGIQMSVFAEPDTAEPADYSNYLTITDLWIVDKDGNKIDTKKPDDPGAGNPAAYSDGLAYYANCGFGFAWDLSLTGGHTLKGGDTVKLKLTWPAVSQSNFKPVKLFDGDQEIGTWEINNSNITITFNSNVENRTDIAGECGMTGGPWHREWKNANDEIRTITLATSTNSNSMTKWYLAKGTGGDGNFFSPLTSTNLAYKEAGTSSGDYLNWFITVGFNTERCLTSENTAVYYKDLLVEDTIDGKFHFGWNHDGNLAYARIQYPASGTSPAASNSYANRINITNKFTELKQNPGETIDAFRTRIKAKPLNVGIYESEDGSSTVMIYLGNFPDSAMGTWESIDAMNLVQNSSGSAWTDQTTGDRKTQWINAHSNSNALGGTINFLTLYLSSDHEQLVGDSEKTNIATLKYEGGQERRTAKNTLQGLTGRAKPAAGNQVDLYKFDEDNNAWISGAKFKLQRKNENGQWVSATNETYTTGEGGKVEIKNIPQSTGTFRLVETEPADDYEAGTEKFYKSDSGGGAGRRNNCRGAFYLTDK